MEVTQAKSSAPSEETTGNYHEGEPFMVDIMSGPNFPLAKAFEMSGWRIRAADLLFSKEHDLLKLDKQEVIRKHPKQADFIWAAMDCSDEKSIREIPRKHVDGRPMPRPLWSEDFPMGIPELQGRDKERVAASNAASEFILGESKLHQSTGGCSGRKNPARLMFRTVHSVSAGACRVRRVKLAIPERPPVEFTGDRREWLQLDTRTLKDWAMITRALAVGLDIDAITKEESRRIIPGRHPTKSGKEQQMAVDEVYTSHGHHSHRQKASMWASLFTMGRHGTVEECLIMYMDHISSSQLTERVEELIGEKLLSDTPEDRPCTAKVLIACTTHG